MSRAIAPALAATAPGSGITLTATATFTDSVGTALSAASNTLTTTVQNAPSLTVTAPSNQNVTPAMKVVDTFTLTNTGNASGAFALSGDATFAGTASAPTLLGYVLAGASSGTCSTATPCTYTTLNAQAGMAGVAINGTVTAGVEYQVVSTSTNNQTIQTTLSVNVTYAAAGSAGAETSANTTAGSPPTDTVEPDARLDLALSSTQPGGAGGISYTLNINNGGYFPTTGLVLNGALTGLPAEAGVFVSIAIPTCCSSAPLAVSGVSASVGNGYSGTATVYYTTDSTGKTGWTTAAPTAGTAYFIGVYAATMLPAGNTGSSAWSGGSAPTVSTPQMVLNFTLAQPTGYGSQTAGSVLVTADSVIGNNAGTQGIVGPGSGSGTAYNAANANTVIQGMVENTIGVSASSPGGSGYSAQTSNQAVNLCYESGRASNVVCQIASGSTSAIGTFAPDVYYSGGGGATQYGTTDGTEFVENPAPVGVYADERNGNGLTYTVPMPASGAYTVRLHFAENYFTSSGGRVFNVLINGAQVVTNLDVVSLVGPKQAYILEFSASPDANGNIVVEYTNGTANQPSVQGLEFLTSPLSPTNLQVSKNGGGTQYTLTWNSSSTASSYDIYRGTSSGGEGGTPYQTGVSSATYVDNVTVGSTYCYRVGAVNANGQSAESNEMCESSSGVISPSYRIASGSASGTSPFAADAYYTGGVSDSTNSSINFTYPSCSPAPQAVYQNNREGTFTYIFSVAASTKYLVRMHFSESYFTTAGGRAFNMSIGGTQVLTNFDIVAATGAQNKAVVEEFMATSTSAGELSVASSNGTHDQPLLSGLEILPVVEPSVGLSLTVAPTGAQPPGTNLTYTETFTNAASSSDASSFVIKHAIPANTDFEVGSVSNSLSNTFLTATVAYSNNNGSTYVYTPTSGGGGAASGYDRNVTNIEWIFTGTLCGGAADNSGSVSFIARVR